MEQTNQNQKAVVRGRDKFAKFKPVINILAKLYGDLPYSFRKNALGGIK